MTNNTINLGIDSILKKYKKGDHVFSVDFGKDEDETKPSFKIHEYEIKSIIQNQVEDAEMFYKISDIKHPKVEIKTNLKSGFFPSAKEAAEEFINSIEYILTESRRSYSEQFNS